MGGVEEEKQRPPWAGADGVAAWPGCCARSGPSELPAPLLRSEGVPVGPTVQRSLRHLSTTLPKWALGNRKQRQPSSLFSPSIIHVQSLSREFRQSCKGGREGDADSNTVPTLAHCLPQQSRGENRVHGTGQGLTPGLRGPRCSRTWPQPLLKSPSLTQQSEQTGQFCLLSGWPAPLWVRPGASPP